MASIITCSSAIIFKTVFLSTFFFNFQVFKEHSIDGSTLALLTDDHLTKRLGMKLGPALKLRSVIMKKLGPKSGGLCVHCAHCHALMQAASAEQRRPAE